MVAKTVRFYDTKKGDREALRILEDYKKYGFRNENHMMIEVLRLYGTEKQDLAEQIAEKVVRKLEGSLVAASPTSEKTDNTFEKTFAFMENL